MWNTDLWLFLLFVLSNDTKNVNVWGCRFPVSRVASINIRTAPLTIRVSRICLAYMSHVATGVTSVETQAVLGILITGNSIGKNKGYRKFRLIGKRPGSDFSSMIHLHFPGDTFTSQFTSVRSSFPGQTFISRSSFHFQVILLFPGRFF